mmetsp:Transcript_52852/g.112288  ORF Transcript_52852/g.112288 Transcript_52852/m.112288 type:complete len:235 (-) Transcript_52852:27-731(-)
MSSHQKEYVLFAVGRNRRIVLQANRVIVAVAMILRKQLSINQWQRKLWQRLVHLPLDDDRSQKTSTPRKEYVFFVVGKRPSTASAVNRMSAISAAVSRVTPKPVTRQRMKNTVNVSLAKTFVLMMKTRLTSFRRKHTMLKAKRELNTTLMMISNIAKTNVNQTSVMMQLKMKKGVNTTMVMNSNIAKTNFNQTSVVMRVMETKTNWVAAMVNLNAKIIPTARSMTSHHVEIPIN